MFYYNFYVISLRFNSHIWEFLKCKSFEFWKPGAILGCDVIDFGLRVLNFTKRFVRNLSDLAVKTLVSGMVRKVVGMNLKIYMQIYTSILGFFTISLIKSTIK